MKTKSKVSPWKRYALTLNPDNSHGMLSANVYTLSEPRSGQYLKLQRQPVTVKTVELLETHALQFGDIVIPPKS